MTAVLTDAAAYPAKPAATRPPASASMPSRTSPRGTTARRHLHAVVVRPAPRREPPFDDELIDGSPVGVHDRPLPFAVPPEPPVRARPLGLSAGLPEPSAWGRRLLIGLVESAGGRRPIHQLSSLLSSSVGRGLRSEFEQPSGHWLSRATVRSVYAGRPCDGVAELAATVETAGRVRAIALRLEERHGRWCCTRLQLG